MKTSSVDNVINSENWEETIKSSGYSLTEVEKFIDDSYRSGYEAKDEEIKARMTDIFCANLSITTKVTRELVDYLMDLKILPLAAYLKIDPIFDFTIIIPVNLNNYISEEMLKAYDWISLTEKRVRSAEYHLDMSFMHGDENLNVESLNSDGFRYKYKMTHYVLPSFSTAAVTMSCPT